MWEIYVELYDEDGEPARIRIRFDDDVWLIEKLNGRGWRVTPPPGKSFRPRRHPRDLLEFVDEVIRHEAPAGPTSPRPEKKETTASLPEAVRQLLNSGRAKILN